MRASRSQARRWLHRLASFLGRHRIVVVAAFLRRILAPARVASQMPPSVGQHFRETNQNPKGDGGAYIYHISTPFGSLLFQDTSGCWSGILSQNIPRTDVALLAAAGRANKNGEPVQGSMAEFIADEAVSLGSGLRRVILGHHDNWLPGFTAPRFDISRIARAVSEKTGGGGRDAGIAVCVGV